MLHSVYQPMIGTRATSLYHVLYELLPAHQVGYSPIEQQRKLFLSMQLEPGAAGRHKLIEATSRLEAVGLLNSSRTFRMQEDDFLYYYHLLPPLLPHEFFSSPHLVLLLRDTIGKQATIRLKEQLYVPEPVTQEQGQEIEDLTMPFYELFRLSSDEQDSQVEAVLEETAAASATVQASEGRATEMPIRFPYEEIIRRFPRASHNRKHVENLKQRKDQFAFINYTALKYRLELYELCRLLDEDGIFDEAGELNEQVFSYRASLCYMQGARLREERDRLEELAMPKPEAELLDEIEVAPEYQLDVPELFAGKCDKDQYNAMLRNEPYTIMLEKFFQGKPSVHVIRLFERIHYSYRMPDEVINVMLHYIHTNQLSWSNAFVESIFTDLLARETRSFEQAVDYIRERLRIAEKSADRRKKGRASSGASARSERKARTSKPAIVTDNVPEDPISDEEYESILRQVRSIQSKLEGE